MHAGNFISLQPPLVSYCWYPPNGARVVATPIVRASMFGIGEQYARRYEKDLLILRQVRDFIHAVCMSQQKSMHGVEM